MKNKNDIFSINLNEEEQSKLEELFDNGGFFIKGEKDEDNIKKLIKKKLKK
jgi:hypothetical protein